MAVVYATLIIKGKKTFAQVPDRLKEQVKEVLIDLDCEHLITDEQQNCSLACDVANVITAPCIF